MAKPLQEETTNVLNAVAGILLRCFLFTTIIMLFVWGLFLSMGDTLYRMQGLFVELSRPDYDRFLLYSMTFMKTLNIVIFLMPFLAIEHFLAGQRKKARGQ
jgi:hypothetical protein